MHLLADQSEVLIERFAERYHRMLGHAVHAHRRGVDQSGHRRGIDDMRFVIRVLRGGGQHQRSEDADAVDHTTQVHAQHPIPILLGVFPDQPTGTYTSVVEQQVNLAETGDGGIGQRLYLLGTRNVGAQANNLGALPGQLGDS
ncbi:hypothetical protein D3C81_1442740 [compost metagenome]